MDNLRETSAMLRKQGLRLIAAADLLDSDGAAPVGRVARVQKQKNKKPKLIKAAGKQRGSKLVEQLQKLLANQSMAPSELIRAGFKSSTVYNLVNKKNGFAKNAEGRWHYTGK